MIRQHGIYKWGLYTGSTSAGSTSEVYTRDPPARDLQVGSIHGIHQRWIYRCMTHQRGIQRRIHTRHQHGIHRPQVVRTSGLFGSRTAASARNASCSRHRPSSARHALRVTTATSNSAGPTPNSAGPPPPHPLDPVGTSVSLQPRLALGRHATQECFPPQHRLTQQARCGLVSGDPRPILPQIEPYVPARILEAS